MSGLEVAILAIPALAGSITKFAKRMFNDTKDCGQKIDEWVASTKSGGDNLFKTYNLDSFKLVYDDIEPAIVEKLVENAKNFVIGELKSVTKDENEIKTQLGALAMLDPALVSGIGKGDCDCCYFRYSQAKGRAGEGHIMWARKDDGKFAFYTLITHVRFELSMSWTDWVKSKAGIWPGLEGADVQDMVQLHIKKATCEKLLADRAVSKAELEDGDDGDA